MNDINIMKAGLTVLLQLGVKWYVTAGKKYSLVSFSLVSESFHGP